MKRWHCYRVTGKHSVRLDAPDADTAIKLARARFQRSVKRPGEIRVRELPLEWPKRADGTPMTMGEMSPEQRRAQAMAACAKLERELASPAMRDAIQRVLDGKVQS